MKTHTRGLKITLEGSDIDGYAELILGIFLMSGILKSSTMTKFEKADSSFALIVRAEVGKPPLGSMGLADIPEEYPKLTMRHVQGGLGYWYIFYDATGSEIYRLESPQMGVLEDVMLLPDAIRAAVLKAAEIIGRNQL